LELPIPIVAENKAENISSVKVLSRVVIANQNKAHKTKIQADLLAIDEKKNNQR
jgi:hypothetical protein